MKAIKTKQASVFFMIILLMGAFSIQGCATMHPRNSVPLDFSGKVTIAGMSDIRTDIDDPDPVVMQKSLIDSFKEEGRRQDIRPDRIFCRIRFQ